MILFDERGNVTPYQLVEVSYLEFKDLFVERFSQDSTRREILGCLEMFLSDFRALVSNSFEIWINGSFCTKKPNPRDLDLVLFLDYSTYVLYEKLIESRFRQEGALLHYKVIDAYVVKAYPEDHPKRELTRSDKGYWTDWFGRMRRNRQGKRYPKGFIKLTF